MQSTAPMIHRRDLRAALGISGETFRIHRMKGKIPPPDVKLSRESEWWKFETLAAAGINVAPSVPASQESAS